MIDQGIGQAFQIGKRIAKGNASKSETFQKCNASERYLKAWTGIRRFIRLYQPHLTDHDNPAFSRLLKLQLATAVASEDEAEILSVSEKMIGITNRQKSGSYCGHYYKARILMEKGKVVKAARLLLPVLNKLKLNSRIPQKVSQPILRLLNQIILKNPSLIDREKLSQLKVVRVYYAMEE